MHHVWTSCEGHVGLSPLDVRREPGSKSEGIAARGAEHGKLEPSQHVVMAASFLVSQWNGSRTSEVLAVLAVTPGVGHGDESPGDEWQGRGTTVVPFLPWLGKEQLVGRPRPMRPAEGLTFA